VPLYRVYLLGAFFYTIDSQQVAVAEQDSGQSNGTACYVVAPNWFDPVYPGDGGTSVVPLYRTYRVYSSESGIDKFLDDLGDVIKGIYNGLTQGPTDPGPDDTDPGDYTASQGEPLVVARYACEPRHFNTSRNYGSEQEVFVVGASGDVYSCATYYFQPVPTIKWRSVLPTGVQFKAAPGSRVGLAHRAEGVLDIFAVSTTDGQIWTASIGAGGQSGECAGWWPVAKGRAASGTWVDAVSCVQNRIDAFAVGIDQTIYTAAWGDNTDNFAIWHSIYGSDNATPQSVAPGTSVTAVSLVSNMIEIYAIFPDHSINFRVMFVSGANEVPSKWQQVAGGIAAPGTSISAIARPAIKRYDLFAVGQDRRIWHADSGSETRMVWEGWNVLPGLTAAENTSVCACSRTDDSIDIFVVASNNIRYSNSLNGSTWSGWRPAYEFGDVVTYLKPPQPPGLIG
jgi:hypothetical protein